MHSVMKAVFDGHECVPIEQLQKVMKSEFIPQHFEPKNCTSWREVKNILF